MLSFDPLSCVESPASQPEAAMVSSDHGPLLNYALVHIRSRNVASTAPQVEGLSEGAHEWKAGL